MSPDPLYEPFGRHSDCAHADEGFAIGNRSNARLSYRIFVDFRPARLRWRVGVSHCPKIAIIAPYGAARPMRVDGSDERRSAKLERSLGAIIDALVSLPQNAQVANREADNLASFLLFV